MSEEKVAAVAEALVWAAIPQANTDAHRNFQVPENAGVIVLAAATKNEIESMKNEIFAMKALLEDERKQKTLERALNLTHLGSFDYDAGPGCSIGRMKSSDLAKTAIEWFMLGYGFNLPSNARVYSNPKNEDFYEKFKGQMKDLIKREPRLVKDDDGSYSIYYS